MTRGAILTEQSFSDELVRQITELELPEAAQRYAGYWNAGSIFHAIDRAARWLRFMPDSPMLDIPVRLTVRQKDDPAKCMLVAMINGSIVRPEAPEGMPTFTTTDPRGADACIKAEGYFVSALDELRKDPDRLSRADVIVEGSVPVFLRKAVGEVSCLTLCEVAVNGIVYPKGTIMRTALDPLAITREETLRTGRAFNIFQSDDITSAGALRLSNFAFPAETRYALESLDYYRIEHPTADTSIDDVADAVRTSIAPFVS